MQSTPLPPESQAPNPILPMTDEEMEHYKLHRRFDRMGRLIGDPAMKTLMGSHVMVIGLGGVGSWAAESLVRSGIGELTIVDFDEVCITNFNRQLQALGGTVGKKKAEVLAERFLKINPTLKLHALTEFYHEDTSESLLSRKPDFIIDAIDSVTSKCHLLNQCVVRGIPIVTSTGSGGRLDPTRVKICDLSETEIDPLARSVRKILRQQYQFPETGPFGIHAVFSDEVATKPEDLIYDQGKGFRCVCPQKDNDYFNCDNRNLIMGNSSFVTGAFGLACASFVVRKLIQSGTVDKQRNLQ